VFGRNVGGSKGWNIARILGNTSVKARILSSTFSSREKNCPSAGNAGIIYLKENWIGERAYGKFQFEQR
jgi:hypothetical protein